MMLTKFVRIQLIIFAVLTVVGLIVMATQYVRVPAMVGIGRYDVTVELPATGGLYKNSNVTYRGQTIGVVNAVELSETGVNARLSLESGVKVPSDVDAAVKSVSAIGEQFVDLIPHTDSSGAIVVDGHLENGSVIPEDRTSIPQDVGAMLDQADLLLQSISDTKLKTVIDESFKAFNGLRPGSAEADRLGSAVRRGGEQQLRRDQDADRAGRSTPGHSGGQQRRHPFLDKQSGDVHRPAPSQRP